MYQGVKSQEGKNLHLYASAQSYLCIAIASSASMWHIYSECSFFQVKNKKHDDKAWALASKYS